MAKKNTAKTDDTDNKDQRSQPIEQQESGDYARSNSQMEDAVNSPANAGVRHGATETDDEGNFTGDGATGKRANDPLANRDAVSPAIQVEKPETNVERSAPADSLTGKETKDDGNWEVRVVEPYDTEGSKDVMENYRKVKEESLRDAPTATMGQDSQNNEGK